MKRSMLKIWSLAMVMVVSISTSGFAINKHYCGGKEKTKAIFFEAEKCAFEAKKICNKHLDDQLNRKNCCEDKASFFKQLLTVDFDFNHADSELDVFEYVDSLLSFYKIQVPKSEKESFVYRPPPIHKDINILFQTFLL